MKRFITTPRKDWQQKVEALGFNYHTLNGEKYWDESVFYEFDGIEVASMKKATEELYRLCLAAVDHVIKEDLFDLFFIPSEFHAMIKSTWNEATPTIYGRFDLSWDGDVHKAPKMLEFNADTPTSLFEASVVQWFWLKDSNHWYDQFNSIHEKLVSGWKKIKPKLNNEVLYFSCLQEYPEDLVNVRYLQNAAITAGITTDFINVHDIGRNATSFTDMQEKKIQNIFKLYPWEWMINEDFGSLLPSANTRWLEPPWKMILSNKAILPVLWELFPDHPNLLECYFDDPREMKDYAMKPLLSREGANVTLVENGVKISETTGDYGDEGFIFQKLHKLPCIDKNYPVIGSWVIDGQAGGIGIRETTSLVTDNFSRFVPHLTK